MTFLRQVHLKGFVLKYRAEIDGLRALAVVPVILFHAGFEWFSGGYVGVDIFFVISGYLITTILVSDIENDRFSITKFYERRARRILPALFFMLIGTTAMAWFTLTQQRLVEYFEGVFYVSAFVSNVYLWLQTGYFAPSSELTYLLHTWTLAVEEQYYLIFPVFLSLAWRFGKNRVFWIIVFFALASLALSEIGWRKSEAANFYLAPTRAWELFAGSIAAFMSSGRALRKSNSLSLLGLGAILFSVFAYDETTPFPSLYTLVPVTGVVLLVLYADTQTHVAKLLSLKIFVGIGLVSYSAYLWHQPFLVFTRLTEFGKVIEPWDGWIAIVLTFIFATFSYYYIEQPFRKKGTDRKFGRKTFLTLSGALLLVSAGLGLLGAKYAYKYAFSDRESKIMSSIERSMATRCENAVNFCTNGQVDKVDLLLLGDSNAYHFSSSLKEIADEHDLKFVNLTLGGCLPLAHFYRLEQGVSFNDRCFKFNSALRTTLEANDFDGTIVISGAWLLYVKGEEFYAGEVADLDLPPLSDTVLSLDGGAPLKENTAQAFSDYLAVTLKFLKEHSSKLVVVGPIPPALKDFERKRSLLNLESGSSESVFDKYSLSLREQLETLQRQIGFELIEPHLSLCNMGKCAIHVGNNYLYGDPTHFSHYGQALIMKPLLSKALGEDLDK